MAEADPNTELNFEKKKKKKKTLKLDDDEMASLETRKSQFSLLISRILFLR